MAIRSEITLEDNATPVVEAHANRADRAFERVEASIMDASRSFDAYERTINETITRSGAVISSAASSFQSFGNAVDKALTQVEDRLGFINGRAVNASERFELAISNMEASLGLLAPAANAAAVQLDKAFEKIELSFGKIPDSALSAANKLEASLSKMEDSLGFIDGRAVTAAERMELSFGRIEDSLELLAPAASEAASNMERAFERIELGFGKIPASAVSASEKLEDALQKMEDNLGFIDGKAVSAADRLEIALGRMEDSFDLIAPAATQASIRLDQALTKMENDFAGIENVSERTLSGLERDLRLAASAASRIGPAFASAFNRVNRAIISTTAPMERFVSRTAGMVSGLFSLRNALIGLGLGFFGKQIFDAGVQVQGLETSLRAVTGSAEEGNRQFEFVSNTAERLGLVLTEVGASYKGILAAMLGAKRELTDAQTIFLGISEAGVAMRLSNEQIAGSLFAVQQAIQKARLFAEEWNQQLQERFPVATAAMAEALGVLPEEIPKMIEAGQVGIDAMIAFGQSLRDRFANEVVDAATRAGAELNRLGNDATRVSKELGEAGLFKAVADVASAFRTLFTVLSESGAVKELGALFEDLGKDFAEFIKTQGPGVVKAFKDIVTFIRQNFMPVLKTIETTWKTVWTGAQIAFNVFVGAFSRVLGTLLGGLAQIVENASAVAGALGFEGVANKLDSVATSLRGAEQATIAWATEADRLKDQYLNDLDEMKREQEGLNDQVGLTADEVKKLGAGAVVAAGQVIDSGRKIRATVDNDIGGPTRKATGEVDKLGRAYSDLKLKSLPELQDAARQSAASFRMILDSGTETRERLIQIFTPIAQQIIEAFGEVPPEFQAIFREVEFITGQSFNTIQNQGSNTASSINNSLGNVLDNIADVSDALARIDSAADRIDNPGGGTGGGDRRPPGDRPRDPADRDPDRELSTLEQSSAFLRPFEFQLADSLSELERQRQGIINIINDPQRFLGSGQTFESIDAWIDGWEQLLAEIDGRIAERVAERNAERERERERFRAATTIQDFGDISGGSRPLGVDIDDTVVGRPSGGEPGALTTQGPSRTGSLEEDREFSGERDDTRESESIVIGTGSSGGRLGDDSIEDGTSGILLDDELFRERRGSSRSSRSNGNTVIVESATFQVVNNGVNAEAIDAEGTAKQLAPALVELSRTGDFEADSRSSIQTD